MNLSVPQVIQAILANDSLDDEECASSKCEEIERLIPDAGWEFVLNGVLAVLKANQRARDFQVAAEVIWGALLDGRSMPENRVIALLYHRLHQPEMTEDNLVWSITSKLNRVDYLSSYNPLNDPAVQAELAALRAK